MPLVRPASPLQQRNADPASSTGGIGAETALLFARAGCNIVLTARRKQQLDEVAALAKKANEEGQTGKGGAVETHVLDMRDRQAIQKFVEGCGKVDVLVSEFWSPRGCVEEGRGRKSGRRRAPLLGRSSSLDVRPQAEYTSDADPLALSPLTQDNAGMVLGTDPVGQIAEEDVTTMFETNVFGLITLTQLFVNSESVFCFPVPALAAPRTSAERNLTRLRHSLLLHLATVFKKQKSGHIINLGSIGELSLHPALGLLRALGAPSIDDPSLISAPQPAKRPTAAEVFTAPPVRSSLSFAQLHSTSNS